MKKLFLALLTLTSFSVFADYSAYQVNLRFNENPSSYQQNPWSINLVFKLKIDNTSKQIVLGEMCSSGETGYFQSNGGNGMSGRTNGIPGKCNELDSDQIFNMITNTKGSKFQVVGLKLTEKTRNYLLTKFNELSLVMIPWGTGDYNRELSNQQMIEVNSLVQLIAKKDGEFLTSFSFKKNSALDDESRGLQGSTWEGVNQMSVSGKFTISGSAPVIKIK